MRHHTLLPAGNKISGPAHLPPIIAENRPDGVLLLDTEENWTRRLSDAQVEHLGHTLLALAALRRAGHHA